MRLLRPSSWPVALKLSDTPAGATARGPGLHLSHPVADEQGRVLGAVVLKLEGEAVSSLLDSLRVGEWGRNLLVDEHGTVLSSTGIPSRTEGRRLRRPFLYLAGVNSSRVWLSRTVSAVGELPRASGNAGSLTGLAQLRRLCHNCGTKEPCA